MSITLQNINRFSQFFHCHYTVFFIYAIFETVRFHKVVPGMPGFANDNFETDFVLSLAAYEL